MSKVIAHRGASGDYFENTMRAFKAAVADGADGIELDVQQTADGGLIVIHDDHLLRLAGIDKKINELTLQEIQSVKVGRKRRLRTVFGHSIPALFDAVSFAKEQQTTLYIELKETVYGDEDAVRKILHYADLLEEVQLSSFDYPTVQLVKQLDPAVETALIVTKKSNWNDLAAYETDALHFHKRLWKEPYKSALIESGKILRVYGITGSEPYLQNTPEISGWITDYPKRVGKKIKGS